MVFKRLFTVWILLNVGFSSFVLAQKAPCTIPELSALLQKIDQRFEDLESLQYSVEKAIKDDKQSTLETYSFAYHKPSSFYAEYTKPNKRVLQLNELELVEYLPTARKALSTNLLKLKAAERRKVIAQVFSRVSIEGLRVGHMRQMLERASAVEPSSTNPNSCVLLGTNPRFKIEVDVDKEVLTHTEIWDEAGELKVRTQSSNFVEVEPGFWMPQNIFATYPSSSGYIKMDVVLSNILINQPIPADTFRFKRPRGVEILTPDKL